MAAVQILVGIAYPVLIYLALSRYEPRQIALFIFAVLALRLLLTAPTKLVGYTRAFWLPVTMVAAVATSTAVWNHPLGLLLTPTLTNLGLLFSFGLTLAGSESMIERFARLQVSDLSEEECAYCRNATLVWCAFFIANGSIALWLALAGALEWWTLYTGLLSYFLMGVLFSLEFTYRHWRFRRYEGGIMDPLLRRVFPPFEPVPPGEASIRPGGGAMGGDRDSSRHPGMLPEVVAERREGHRLEQDLLVPDDLACWPGHFPAQFVVPGVLQVDWIMGLVEQWLGAPPDLSGIEALKFKKPILPGQRCTLTLEADTAPGRFRFRIAEGNEVFSEGRVVLVAEEGGEA